MNKLDAAAYTCAFKAIFECAKKSCPNFGVGKSLNGVIADWSDAQLQGLQGAIGEDLANKMMKGCQASPCMFTSFFYMHGIT